MIKPKEQYTHEDTMKLVEKGFSIFKKMDAILESRKKLEAENEVLNQNALVLISEYTKNKTLLDYVSKNVKTNLTDHEEKTILNDYFKELENKYCNDENT